MNEEIINFGNNNSLVGIYTNVDPKFDIPNRPCLIFLNPGFVHKVGTNRLYVKMARHYSELGIESFRFDFSGIGDSPSYLSNKDDYNDTWQKEVIQAMELISHSKSINKFILVGMCSSVIISFNAALKDDRISGLILIDGLFQNYNYDFEIIKIAERNCKIRYYRKHLFDLKRWAKILTGKSNAINSKNIALVYRKLLSVKQKIINGFTKQSNNINKKTFSDDCSDLSGWLMLFEKKIKIYLIFCEGDFMIDVFKLTLKEGLEAINKDKFLKINYLKDVDHIFTTTWSQEYLLQLIENWINEEIICISK